MADGDQSVTYTSEHCRNEASRLNALGDAEEAAVSTLKVLLADLEHNSDQLAIVKKAYAGAPVAATIISSCTVEGEGSFIRGAMYCGQEIGGSEVFANIKTQIETIKDNVNIQNDSVETTISAYTSSIAKVKEEITAHEALRDSYYSEAQTWSNKAKTAPI